jgi:hypothetical protein
VAPLAAAEAKCAARRAAVLPTGWVDAGKPRYGERDPSRIQWRRALLLVLLVMDDDRGSCLLLRTMITSLGHSCDLVHNIADGLRTAGNKHYALVLIGSFFPDQDSIPALQPVTKSSLNSLVAHMALVRLKLARWSRYPETTADRSIEPCITNSLKCLFFHWSS